MNRFLPQRLVCFRRKCPRASGVVGLKKPNLIFALKTPGSNFLKSSSGFITFACGLWKHVQQAEGGLQAKEATRMQFDASLLPCHDVEEIENLKAAEEGKEHAPSLLISLQRRGIPFSSALVANEEQSLWATKILVFPHIKLHVHESRM